MKKMTNLFEAVKKGVQHGFPPEHLKTVSDASSVVPTSFGPLSGHPSPATEV